VTACQLAAVERVFLAAKNEFYIKWVIRAEDQNNHLKIYVLERFSL
jgi:hypothetical protein